MSSKAEIYNTLSRIAEIFSSKPSRQQLEYISSKLEGRNEKDVKIAIENFAESNKYFPTYQNILDEIRNIKKTKEKSFQKCDKCKGSGLVILFHKELFISSAFACSCENGKVFSNFENEKYSGTNWTERIFFQDKRCSMTISQLEERKSEYWTFVIKNQNK